MKKDFFKECRERQCSQISPVECVCNMEWRGIRPDDPSDDCQCSA